MGVFLKLAGIYIPGFVRRRKLVRLFAATADAFETAMPDLDGLGLEDCLEKYALFTRENAEESLRSGTEASVRQRLYDNAYRLGAGLREEFGVKSVAGTMRLARIVYGIVGIDFRGAPEGDVIIERCFFSSFYSPDVCGVVSSLDAGLLAGLSGGARLSFSERLTEGHDCCRARLSTGTRLS